MLSKEKLELLKKLQEKEHTWSASLMTNGICTTEMLKTEREIKSLRIKASRCSRTLSCNRLSFKNLKTKLFS